MQKLCEIATKAAPLMKADGEQLKKMGLVRCGEESVKLADEMMAALLDLHGKVYVDQLGAVAYLDFKDHVDRKRVANTAEGGGE